MDGTFAAPLLTLETRCTLRQHQPSGDAAIPLPGAPPPMAVGLGALGLAHRRG